jgi:hypothetical protein
VQGMRNGGPKGVGAGGAVWGPTMDTEDLCGDTSEGAFTWVQTLDDVELISLCKPIKILFLPFPDPPQHNHMLPHLFIPIPIPICIINLIYLF